MCQPVRTLGRSVEEGLSHRGYSGRETQTARNGCHRSEVMPVQTAAVGRPLPPHEQNVTAREILAYAAGIGDTSAHVFNDTGELFMAPPAYCVRLEWPVVSHPETRDIWQAPEDELRRGVHAFQDSLFHRPVRAGDVLTTTGCISGVEETPAGARTTTRLETHDSAGRLMTTSWSQSILRGVGVAGESRLDEAPPELPEVSFAGGPAVPIMIDKAMPHVYTECARIWNPIHTERRVALAAGLPDVILHGTATWALAGRAATRLYCSGRPDRLRRLAGRFTGMVLPGHEIEIQFGEPVPVGDDQHAVGFTVATHDGQLAMRGGVVVFEAG